MRRTRRNAIHPGSAEAAIVKRVGLEHASREVDLAMRSLTIRRHDIPASLGVSISNVDNLQRNHSPNSPAELSLSDHKNNYLDYSNRDDHKDYKDSHYDYNNEVFHNNNSNNNITSNINDEYVNNGHNCDGNNSDSKVDSNDSPYDVDFESQLLTPRGISTIPWKGNENVRRNSELF